MNTTLVFPFIIRDSRLKEAAGISPTQARRLPDFPPKRQWSPGVTGYSGEEVAAWVRGHGRIITEKRPICGRGK